MSDEWEEDEEEGPFASEHAPFSRAGLAVGGLALVPLLAIYELSLGDVDGRRSTAELVLSAGATRLDWPVPLLRWALVVALGTVCAVVVVRRGRGLVPPVLGVLLEGVVGGLVLGPVLVGLMHLLGAFVAMPTLGAGGAEVPAIAKAGFVLGAAAWEEILCRLMLYGALLVVGRRLAAFFGAGERSAAALGEILGLVGSAAAYVALHMAAFTSWLGAGGETFEPSAFTWRFVTGILLGLLFRWRGAGVAAWTHGLFNLALLLGAGPDVLVGPL